MAEPTVLLLSTSDTDLLSARAANGAGGLVPFRYANPALESPGRGVQVRR